METKLKTIEFDEEFLRQKSVDVDLSNDEYKKDIEKLKKYCLNNRVYALAPVQIGIPKRMIYLRNTNQDMNKNTDKNYNEDKVLINPVIIKEKGHARFLEGCESCLNYVGIVDRPYQVEVEYLDIEGNIIHDIFEGFKATVFCHEYDHLNGVLHIDIAQKVMRMTREEINNYRNKHPYEILSKEDDYLRKNK